MTNPWAYICTTCGELFGAQVWHCLECDHHWSVEYDDQCKNCYRDRPEPEGAAA